MQNVRVVFQVTRIANTVKTLTKVYHQRKEGSTTKELKARVRTFLSLSSQLDSLKAV
jgi:hypothetical protein